MFDIGWMEMAVIAFVALIVIGPKDLPKAMRSVAMWVRKARALSREFQSGLDEMMREAELDEAKKSIESVRRHRVDKLIEEELDPTGSVSRELKDLDDEARDRPKAKSSAVDETGPAEPAKPAEAGQGAVPEAKQSAEPASAEPKKGKVVSHPAQMAPGNSVKPPASSVSEAPAEASEPPRPAKSSSSGGAAD